MPDAGTCNECGAPIKWVTSAKPPKPGEQPKKIPLDLNVIKGFDEVGAMHSVRTVHMATCPYRNRLESERMQAAHRKRLAEGA